MSLAQARPASSQQAVISVSNLRKWYATGGGFGFNRTPPVKAVNDISFAIAPGEVLGLVGESGSGKSTVGRLTLRLSEPTDGRIEFEGVDITRHGRRQLRPLRHKMQMIFQDPYSSLNPRMTIKQIVSAPLDIQKGASDRDATAQRVSEVLETVGLNRNYAERYPHEFSGGQRQRISIARALVTAPRFLVADEPVSALDVSVQAQVLKILRHVRDQYSLGVLFISHDLAVVNYLCDRVAVMYLGRIVELASTEDLFRYPLHPYSEALFSAVPLVERGRRRERIILKGDVPSPMNPPSGCSFRTRCRYALPACATEVPALREVRPNHFKACIRDDLALQTWDGSKPSMAS